MEEAVFFVPVVSHSEQSRRSNPLQGLMTAILWMMRMMQAVQQGVSVLSEIPLQTSQKLGAFFFSASVSRFSSR
jgi:hypothetical protein